MTFYFFWILDFSDISVLVTFQFWWIFSLDEISIRWHFSFGDISILGTFHFWWLFSFGDISVSVLLWISLTMVYDQIIKQPNSTPNIVPLWHFNLSEFQVLVTFQFWWDFSFGENSVCMKFQLGDISVSVLLWTSLTMACAQTIKQPNSTPNIEPLQICVLLVGIGKSGDLQFHQLTTPYFILL